MRNRTAITMMVITGMLLSIDCSAQGLATEIKGLQSVLDQLYNEMMGSAAV
jgi:hypothetical protein